MYDSAIIIYAAYIYDYHYYNSYEIIPPIEKQIPFWKDNRTYQTGRSVPTPITTVDRVNLSNLTVAFGACCRNVYEFLPGFKKHIQEFGSLFKEYRVFFGESDSEDGTVEFLQRWANEDPGHVDVFSGGKQVYTTSIFRTVRLAICRNTILQRARKSMPNMDYYIVLDVDITSKPGFNITRFLTNFIYPLDSWAVMTASHPVYYHDIWALRIPQVLDFDFRAQSRRYSLFTFTYKRVMDRLARIHNTGIPDGHPLIEVESAFGGAAIYAFKYVKEECTYDGWMSTGFWLFREQCEHVTFNQCVRKHAGPGKYFINPSFIVAL